MITTVENPPRFEDVFPTGTVVNFHCHVSLLEANNPLVMVNNPQGNNTQGNNPR